MKKEKGIIGYQGDVAIHDMVYRKEEKTTPMQAFESIKSEVGTPYFSALYDIDMWREDLSIVEKSLKALEIIKTKRVDVWLLIMMLDHGYEYITRPKGLKISETQLTEEEYNLLKEVLCN